MLIFIKTKHCSLARKRFICLC